MTVVSQELIKQLHDQYAHHAIAIVNDGREVMPQCFLIGVDDDGKVTDTVGTPPKLMQMFFGSPTGKDLFAAYLKDLLDDGSEVRESAKSIFGFAPSAIVQINEAWARFAEKDDLDDGVAPSQHPDRQEVLLISVHIRQGTTINMHRIMEQPKRHAEFKELEMGQITLGGRFTMQDAFGPQDNPVH